MISDILRQLNWVDLLVMVVFIRILSMAVSSGFPLEIFKLLGTGVSFYASLHYFAALTDWLNRRSPDLREKTPLQFLDFFSLIALAIAAYLIFVALRLIFDKLVKMQVTTVINRLVALGLGLARGWLLCGIISFALAISSIVYLKGSVADSFLGKRFARAAIQTYTWMWDHAASKFSRGEKFNSAVTEAQKQLVP